MRTYIYADESGNFDFSRNPGATRYFLLTTVVINDHSLEAELLELRRELAWEGVHIRRGFHAANDLQRVRNRVYEALRNCDIRIDATILEKRKAEPRLRQTDGDFYGFAWYQHLRQVLRETPMNSGETLITAASIGTNEMDANLQSAVQAVSSEECPNATVRATMWSAASAPNLQIADYCSWAIFRKWERFDTRSYDIIREKVVTEHDLFESGNAHYY